MTFLFRRSARHANSGFALVLALSLMSFVLLLLISLVTFVRVETQTAAQSLKSLEAKQNALLGAMIALGRIQSLTGPDTRVTARADLLENSSGVTDNTRLWTGAWDSGSGDFLGWLVSNEWSTAEEGDAATAPAGNTSVTLLGNGSQSGAEILAPTVGIDSVEGGGGSYAFWVSDEGVKARFQGPQPSERLENPTVERLEADFRLNQSNAVEFFTDSSTGPGTQPFTYAMRNQPRSFTWDQLLLPDTSTTENPTEAALKSAYADFTAYSVGLLTNTKDGGWKKDLTSMFESKLSASIAPMSDLISPQWPLAESWTAPAGRASWLYKPTFALLRDYYELHRKNDADPIEAKVPDEDEMGISPIITHFNFSYIPGVNGSVSDNGTAMDFDDDYFEGFLRVYLDVRLILWNPYDVPITLPQCDLEILLPDPFLTQNSQDKAADTSVRFLFGNPTLNAQGTVNGGEYYLSKTFWEFKGLAGAGFTRFSDPFHRDYKSFILSFVIPETTLQPGESRPFTIAADEDGQPYSGENLLENRSGEAGATPPYSVWLQDPVRYDNTPATTTTGLDGIKIRQLPFMNYKTNNTGGLIFHSLGLRPLDEAGSANPESYYGRFFRQLGKWDSSTVNVNDPAPDFLTGIFGFAAPRPNDSKAHIPVHGGPQIAEASIEGRHSRQFHLWMNEIKAGNFVRFAYNFNTRALYHSIIRNAPGQFGAETNPPFGGGEWLYGQTTFYDAPYLNDDSVTGVSEVLPEISSPVDKLILYSLPFEGSKPLSIADFRHADVYSFTGSNNYPIGNSLIDLRLPPGSAPSRPSATSYIPSDLYLYSPIIDTSYFLNEGLWDAYFMSTIDGSLDDDALDTGTPLPNARIQRAEGQTLASLDALSDIDRVNQTAESLQVLGQFNVNSTSKEAWKVLFGTSNELEYDPESRASGSALDGASFSRLLRPGSGENRAWTSYRTLDAIELDSLAGEIVKQIKARGPFLSLSDFVNREVGGAITATGTAVATGLQGALAQAIEDAGINTNTKLDLPDVELNSRPANRPYYLEAPLIGSLSAGATRWLMQGDILAKIGGMLSNRSDTFVIRSYGSATAGMNSGEPANAYLELVVQRTAKEIDSTSTSTVDFGRAYKIVALRWLPEGEI